MPVLYNARREKFVQNIISGMSQRKAYIDAFPEAQYSKPNVIDVRACELFKEPDVSERYAELQSMSASSSVISREQRMMILTDIATDEELYPKARMQAIDILNKMDGDYVKKVEATVTTPITDIAEKVSDILNE